MLTQNAKEVKQVARKNKTFSFDFSSLDFTDPDDEQIQEVPHLSLKPVEFENAEELIEEIDYSKDYFCFVSGSFIFGDFIEALLYKEMLKPYKLYITTLGMSQENIDSLVNMTWYLKSQQLYLLISNYFVALERNKLVPYMEKEFAGEPIDVAVLASHCKLALIRSYKGDILITGSANLSSSNNVEQFIITHDKTAIDYIENKLSYIFNRFTVYKGKEEHPRFNYGNNKDNTGRKAWQAIKGDE